MDTNIQSAEGSVRKSKLFLSCGQNSEFNELEYGEQVKQALKDLEFEVFFAPEVDSSSPLAKVIFDELRESDYYVLVDFKREELVLPKGSEPKSEDKKPAFRGSLFCQQEFAIACFLQLEIALFHQEGVEQLRGVIGEVLGHSIAFPEPKDAAKKVREEIEARGWLLASRNQLCLRFCGYDKSKKPDDWAAKKDEEQKKLKVSYRHINVQNMHKRKAATGCYVYIERIKDLSTGKYVRVPTCELKWEGTSLQGVRIVPEGNRSFDAMIVICEGGPPALWFMPDTDALHNHVIKVTESAHLEVTYVVCSNEFPDARQTFDVAYDVARNTVEIQPKTSLGTGSQPQLDVLSRDDKVMSGEVVFTGTRVPVRSLFDHFKAGDSLGDFLTGFPSVSLGQAQTVLECSRSALGR